MSVDFRRTTRQCTPDGDILYVKNGLVSSWAGPAKQLFLSQGRLPTILSGFRAYL
jgi:hypothetical protein